MSHRFSLAATAVVIGMVVLAAPASAVMQITPMPDPNAPAQNSAPYGLFDKSIPDTWQKKSEDGAQQNLNSFHFTVSGSSSSGAYNTSGAPSAYDAAKRPGSEFYEPLPGVDPFTGRTNQDPFSLR